MPTHLKALAVILPLAIMIFAIAKPNACALAIDKENFERRRNLWFAITFVAFFAHNFWIYTVVCAVLLLRSLGREPNKIAMFLFLVVAVPPLSADIGGLGIANALFSIDYLRLLALTVLLVAFNSLRKQPDLMRFGRSLPDKLIACYLILNFLLLLVHTTFTAALRQGIFYSFVDIFLPYFVASRSLKNIEGFRDALMSFVVAALVLTPFAAFEFASGWLLYANLGDVLGAHWGYGDYNVRAGALRAQASLGEPISLGYVCVVAMGFFLYLKRSVPNQLVWGIGFTALVVGMVATLSRGPWVGAAALVLVFIAAGPSAGSRILKLALLGILILPAVLATPLGDKIIDHLPFVGTVDDWSVNYRQRLLAISIQVMLDSPFFGSPNFMEADAMQELIQGQGIIDLVNTYVAVGLGRGFVGLTFFVGFFLAVIFWMYKSMRSVTDKNDERHLLGQALIAALVAILVIIFTVSSINAIPVIYWTVAGLGVAYAQMLAPEKAPAPTFRNQRAPLRSESYLRKRNVWP